VFTQVVAASTTETIDVLSPTGHALADAHLASR